MKCRRYYEGITISWLLGSSFLFIGTYAMTKRDKNIMLFSLAMTIFFAIVGVLIVYKAYKSPGRLHSSERKDIKIKPEEGCFENWDGQAPVDIDGVCIDGKKYKVMNGVDVKITKEGKIKYCSALAGFLNEMWQKEEREAMESSDCWKC